MSLERFVVNFGGATVRREMLEGREHYVAPAAMIAEGVWAGSGGRLLYRGEDLGRSSKSWDHKPIVVYHPKDAKGRPVSACSPNVLNTRKVGILLNSRYDDKLRTECWFDIERTKAVDARIIKALEAGNPIEGSTGLFVENDKAAGEYGGAEYDGVATDYNPDHFAVLPDQKGAYSIADGGGVLAVNVAATEPERVQVILRRGVERALAAAGAELTANDLSFSSQTRQLADLLSEKFGKPGKYWDGYIHEVYKDSVLFCMADDLSAGGMWRIKYTTKDDAVVLKGEATKVERVVEYRPVGNSNEGDTTMAFDKKAHIAGLIGNGWEEADRPVLEALPDAQLEKIKPAKAVVANTAPASFATGTLPAATVITAPAVPVTEPAKPSLQEIVANSDAETQAQFNTLLNHSRRWAAFENSEKEKAVAVIVANSRGKFKKEHLMGKDLDELRAWAAVLTPVDDSPPSGPARFDFGAGTEEPVANAEPVVPLTRVKTFAKAEANGTTAAAQ